MTHITKELMLDEEIPRTEQLALRVGHHPCDSNAVFAVDSLGLEVAVCLSPTICMFGDFDSNTFSYMCIVGSDKPVPAKAGIEAIIAVAESLGLLALMREGEYKYEILHQPGHPQKKTEDGQQVFVEAYLLIVPVSEAKFMRTASMIQVAAKAVDALLALRAAKDAPVRKLSDAIPPTSTIQ